MYNSKERNVVRSNSQKGIFLVLLIILLPVFICLLILLFDLGKQFIISKQAQNVADLAVNSGIVKLLKVDPSDPQTISKENYRNIKPTIRNVLSLVQIFGAAPIAGNSFTTGDTTHFPHEITGYNNDQLKALSPGRSTITITVRRGVGCFDAANQPQLIDLESSAASNYWCLANYIQATVSVTNISTLFASFIGVAELGQITRDAMAQIRAVPEACGVPSCANYAPYLIETGGLWQINTSNEPTCITP